MNTFIIAVFLVVFLYYAFSLGTVTTGSLKEWVDKDFPEIVHQPKPTWLLGFRYKKHGIDEIAMLDNPVFLDYEHSGYLGRFSVTGNVAVGNSRLHDLAQKQGKDLVTYYFEMEIEQLHGGKLAIEDLYRQISITEIEPIIEENACESTTYRFEARA